MAHLLRVVLALWLCVFGAQAFAAVPTITKQAPEGWCRAKAGNTGALGCVSGEGASGRVATGELVIAQLWATDNAGLAAQYKRTPDGPVTCGAFSGSNSVNCTQSGYWMNGATKVTTSQGASIFAYCPVVGGSRVSPGGTVEAQACTTAATCPANSSLSGGSCSCNTGYLEDSTHTSCVLAPNDCQQKMGQSDGLWKYDGGYGAQPSSLASEVCKQSSGGVRCVVKVSNPKCTQGRLQGVGNPYWYCKGEAFYTGGYGIGGACDRNTSAGGDGGSAGSLPEVTIKPPPDELPPGTAAPSSCPQGTFEGTVNGTHTCVEDVGSPTAGQSPQTGQETNQNADGSTTTTTTTGTTVCANGTCTTTNNISSNITNNPASTCPAGTTASGPSGSASSCTGTKASSTTQAQSEFCKSHPDDKQCGGKEGGGFAGACATGFVATGEDPILNAMAKEQYTRNCEILRTDTEPSTWAAAEGAKTDNAMKDNPNNSTATIGPSNFDMGDSLGGGGCNLNKTVVVRGYSVALPFNVLCNPLAVLGQILVAVSLLLAARIVTRG